MRAKRTTWPALRMPCYATRKRNTRNRHIPDAFTERKVAESPLRLAMETTGEPTTSFFFSSAPDPRRLSPPDVETGSAQRSFRGSVGGSQITGRHENLNVVQLNSAALAFYTMRITIINPCEHHWLSCIIRPS